VIAVIFETVPQPGKRDSYLDAAAALRPQLEKVDGFISIERFESLVSPGKILSLSFWRDEEAVQRWRNLEAHRRIQAEGRKSIFADYRLRVARVLRDYGMDDREQAPEDSRQVHGPRRRSDDLLSASERDPFGPIARPVVAPQRCASKGSIS
jgi:heme-degrading monooxygenase HmoA